MISVERVLVETGARLSRSILWELQRSYFRDEGVHAWADRVPFYVTSNLVIADAYANVVVRHLEGLARRGQLAPGRPVVIVELGAGTGRFGFYVLRALARLRRALGVAVPIRYVMTDFTESNLRYMAGHEALAPFVDAGELAFGRFDVERDERIELDSGEALDAGGNPMIVFANYVFDSIKHDLFRVRDGVLEEGLVELSVQKDALEQDGERLVVHDLNHLRSNFAFVPVEGAAYYDEPRLDALLERYRLAGDRQLLLPIGALRAIEALRQLAGDRLLLLAADRGHDRLEEIGADGPGLLFHGSFSLLVNFDAIGWWVEREGGAWYRPAPRPGLKCQAFAFGDGWRECPETRHALAIHFDEWSPADYFALHRHMRSRLEQGSLPAIVAYLRLCKWDPRLLDACAEAIHDRVDGAQPATLETLADGLGRLAENFYFIPGTPDTPAQVASLYQRLSRFEEALAQYRVSTQHFGEEPTVTLNMALCHAGLDRVEEAFAGLRRAASFEETAASATEWLARLEGELERAAD